MWLLNNLRKFIVKMTSPLCKNFVHYVPSVSDYPSKIKPIKTKIKTSNDRRTAKNNNKTENN